MLLIGEKAFTETPDYWHSRPARHALRLRTRRLPPPFLTNEFIMALLEEREPATGLYEALAYCVPGIVAHQSALREGEQLPAPTFDPKGPGIGGRGSGIGDQKDASVTENSAARGGAEV